MSIYTISSINNHIKTLKMQQKWTRRQQEGIYTGEKKTLDQWLHDQTSSKPEIPDPMRPEPQDLNLQNIQQKVSNGKKLTAEEKEYLQKHDPETLEKAREVERARESFKQALKRCRTKEDVQRLRMTQLSNSLTTINAVENNANIPQHKKLEIALLENSKVNAIEGEIRKHIQDGLYEKLPTEAEQIQAEQQENEANRPEPIEKPEHEASPDGTEAEPPAEPDIPVDSQEARPEKPDIDVESPEQRKVRRAKAQAAYGHAAVSSDVTAPSAEVKIMHLDTQV